MGYKSNSATAKVPDEGEKAEQRAGNMRAGGREEANRGNAEPNGRRGKHGITRRGVRQAKRNRERTVMPSKGTADGASRAQPDAGARRPRNAKEEGQRKMG